MSSESTSDVMHGQTVVLTGASDGIGRAAARMYVRAGASVVMIGRNAAKTVAAAQSIMSECGRRTVTCEIADLSRQDAVRDLAARLFQPAVEAAIARHDLTSFVYHTVSSRAGNRVISVGGNAPGIARNAFGLMGAVSFLLETRGVGIGLDPRRSRNRRRPWRSPRGNYYPGARGQARRGKHYRHRPHCCEHRRRVAPVGSTYRRRQECPPPHARYAQRVRHRTACPSRRQ